MRGALYDRRVFAVDNALSTTFFRPTIQPTYGGLAHEERWFELSHIVGILLSIYYYGFITDAAHAAQMCLAEAVWGSLWPLLGDAASTATATAEQPAAKRIT